MAHLCRKDVIPTRLVIGTMLFTACFVSYMVRINMSIDLIAMVEPTKNSNGSATVPECLAKEPSRKNSSDGTHEKLTSLPNYGPRYNWDTKLQGIILGSYFWGLTITCIPGGILAEKFGPTRTVTISTLIAGALTALAPFLTSWHYVALIIARFVIGLCGGVIYPCLHCLISRWAPPEEKGKFIGSLMGGTFGTVIIWPFLGYIIEHLGWYWSFFVNGCIVLFWCILWALLVSDSPDTHPRISVEEKSYIIKSLGDTIKRTKGLPPYKEIFLSLPFWALLLLHFANIWGIFFLMTAGPNFFSTVLGFDLGHTGFLASLPYLARLISGLIFGSIGDVIRKRKLLSTNLVRKGFVLFSHIVPGVLLLVLNVTGCDVNWAVVLVTTSLGSNGASTLTNLQNFQDLAPNYAGSLYGVITCIGSTTGFITPLIVGQLTSKHNGLYEWHIIFSIGAIVYIVCGLVFCVFGSAELQPWNDNNKQEQNTEKGGIQNPAFDNSSQVTIKAEDSVIENTKE